MLSVPPAISVDFVLMSAPLSCEPLEVAERFEGRFRRLEHREKAVRRREAKIDATIEAHLRDVAHSKSLQIYQPSVSLPCYTRDVY
jgi:hypothetical protein